MGVLLRYLVPLALFVQFLFQTFQNLSLPDDAASHLDFQILDKIFRTGLKQFEFIIYFKVGQILLGSLWDVINMDFQQQCHFKKQTNTLQLSFHFAILFLVD